MTDNQQIEEMARMMCGYNAQHFECNDCKKAIWECAYEKYAEALYNAEYRKIPENAVVLTEEEYNALMLEQKRLNKVVKHFQEMIECGKLVSSTQTRKETAKEIYITGKYYYAKHSPMKRQLGDFLAHIKETYGVEVEE